MKLLLVIVSFITVSAVDGQDFSDGEPLQPVLTDLLEQNVDQDSPIVAETNKIAEISGSAHDDQQRMGMEQEQHQVKLRRSRCKARNSCVVMGGFCVTNETLCGGRLVPEGCKRPGCQCCVPGTLEARFDNLEMELQSIKESMNNSDSKLNEEFEALKDNIANSTLKLMIQNLETELNSANVNLVSDTSEMKMKLNSIMFNLTNHHSEIKNDLHSLKHNITDSFGDQDLKMDTIIKVINGCPAGFFQPDGSGQCFKIFKDVTRTWTQAKQKCQDEGLMLATPAPEITVNLRENLLRIYGDRSWSWVDAKGNGSKMIWQKTMTEFRENGLLHNSLSGSTSRCLLLLVGTADRNSRPNGPYDDHSCTSTSYYALCEVH